MATYNRYKGNGSRPERINEPDAALKRRMVPPKPSSKKAPLQKAQPAGRIMSYIPQKLGELETEDLLLILILYLMYRESGDKELLIIMGAMYLL